MSESVCFTVYEIPPSMNQMNGASIQRLRGLKDKWQKLIGEQLMITRQREILIGWMFKPHKVRFEMTVHHSKVSDDDNLQSMTKIPLDVLVSRKRLYLLAGDSPKHIERMPVVERKSTRKDARTEFRLTRLT